MVFLKPGNLTTRLLRSRGCKGSVFISLSQTWAILQPYRHFKEKRAGANPIACVETAGNIADHTNSSTMPLQENTLFVQMVVVCRLGRVFEHGGVVGPNL